MKTEELGVSELPCRGSASRAPFCALRSRRRPMPRLRQVITTLAVFLSVPLACGQGGSGGSPGFGSEGGSPPAGDQDGSSGGGPGTDGSSGSGSGSSGGAGGSSGSGSGSSSGADGSVGPGVDSGIIPVPVPSTDRTKVQLRDGWK